MNPAQLVLASQSPRRKQLLEQIGVQFIVAPANVPEVYSATETPLEYVQRLALEKASFIAQQYDDSVAVLGADTIGVCDGRVLEKPTSLADAKSMLLAMSGRDHEVISAVAIVWGETKLVNTSTTLVTFRSISESEIEAYWRTGEPQDRSGSYAIQGYGGVFVEKIVGSYSNVVGLPIEILVPMFKEIGVPIWLR